MVTSIVTLLAIGIAAGAGTHRNRFRPASRARQQPPGAEGPASPTGPVNRKSGPDTGLPIRRSRQSGKNPGAFDRREREGASQTKVKRTCQQLS
jgi:hypothetical protein